MDYLGKGKVLTNTDLDLVYMCNNIAYRAIEPLKDTAREIPSTRQP